MFLLAKGSGKAALVLEAKATGPVGSRCWGSRVLGWGRAPAASGALRTSFLSFPRPPTPHPGKGEPGLWGRGCVTGFEKRREVMENGPRPSQLMGRGFKNRVPRDGRRGVAAPASLSPGGS